MVNTESLARTNEQQQQGLIGWKTYTFLAIVAGVAARKHLRGRFPSGQGGGQQQKTRWFTPSEAELWQERMDEIERKERLRRVQDAFSSRQSSFTNPKSARYHKWEEHPQQQTSQQKAKDKLEAERAAMKEKARLRHHYVILGLDPLKDEGFTEDEIKSAFRERALQYHPDKNPDKIDETREKFRELVDSYGIIKKEKNIK